jgi:chromosome segregation ATPase
MTIDDETFFSEIEQYRQEKVSSFNSLVDDIKTVTALLTKQRKELERIQSILIATENKEKEVQANILTLKKEITALTKQKDKAERDFTEYQKDTAEHKQRIENDLRTIKNKFQTTMEKQSQALQDQRDEKQKEIDYLQTIINTERENYIQAVALAKQQAETERQKIGDMSKGSFIRKVQEILDKKKIPLDLLKELN